MRLKHQDGDLKEKKKTNSIWFLSDLREKGGMLEVSQTPDRGPLRM